MGDKLALLRKAMNKGLPVLISNTRSGKTHKGIVEALDERIPSFPSARIRLEGDVRHHPDLRSVFVVVAFA